MRTRTRTSPTHLTRAAGGALFVVSFAACAREVTVDVEDGTSATSGTQSAASSSATATTSSGPTSGSGAGAATSSSSTGVGGATGGWARSFGGAGFEEGKAIGADASGAVVIAGYTTDTVDLGGGPLTTGGYHDIVVAKLDAQGGHIWSKRFGEGAKDVEPKLAVAPQGEVLLMGDHAGAIDLGGGALVSAGPWSAFVGRFAVDGSHVWSRQFTGNGASVYSGAVAWDGAGGAVVGGRFSGTVDFGKGPKTSASESSAYMVRLAPDGSTSWARSFGGPGEHTVTGLSVSPTGEVFATGWFTNTLDAGAGAVLTSVAEADAFVAKLTADGTTVWVKRLGGPLGQWSSAVCAVDGGVALAGIFEDSVDVGGATLVSTGLYDGLLVKLDASGALDWAAQLTGADSQYPMSLAVGAGGELVVGGFAYGATDLGDGMLLGTPTDNLAFAATYSGDGALLARHVGLSSFVSGGFAHADGAGRVLLTGGFYDAPFDLEAELGVSLPHATEIDWFVASFDP